MAKSVLRVRAVQWAFLLGFAVLIVRAAQVQLVMGSHYAERAKESRTETRELPAPRGAIADRNGTLLAMTRTVYHVDMTRREFRHVDSTVTTIARALGVTERHVRRLTRDSYAYLHGPFTSEQVAALRDVPGVHLSEELTRFHPNPGLARALVGRPGAPGRPPTGLEQALDTVLTGQPGSAVLLRDQFGREYESPSRAGSLPIAGHNVYLTIDAALQDLVEEALEEAVVEFGASGGDLLVMRPSTGEILAAVSRRDGGVAAAAVFTEVYEPGSTAKIFAAAALLEAGAVAAGDSVWGEDGEFRIGGRTVHDEHEEGWMRLSDVVRRSSNVGIAKFIQRVTSEQQYLVLRRFGFGTPAGIEYPWEAEGILHRPHHWSGTSAVSLAMGYEMAVTVLQLASAYAAIANDGVLLQPGLVSRVTTADGREVYRHRPTPIRRAVSPAVAAELRSMLRRVTAEGGTGESAALTTYEVAGKTGTAKRSDGYRYIPGSYVSSFASIFPAADPQLVMVVKLDDPKNVFARLNAAPLTRSVLEQVLAGQSAALDHARMAKGASGSRPSRSRMSRESPPIVVPWPSAPEQADTTARSVPDVEGLSLRAAVRTLHRAGLRVHTTGWGTIVKTDPAPGTTVQGLTLVRVVGSQRSP